MNPNRAASHPLTESRLGFSTYCVFAIDKMGADFGGSGVQSRSPWDGLKARFDAACARRALLLEQRSEADVDDVDVLVAHEGWRGPACRGVVRLSPPAIAK